MSRDSGHAAGDEGGRRGAHMVGTGSFLRGHRAMGMGREGQAGQDEETEQLNVFTNGILLLFCLKNVN